MGEGQPVNEYARLRAVAVRHYSRMQTMNLMGWPQVCTVSALLLTPQLRKISPYRVLIGYGPGDVPHAWSESTVSGLAVCCTYGQFEKGRTWVIAPAAELGFTMTRRLSLREEREVTISGRVLDDKLCLGTSLAAEFSRMRLAKDPSGL